MKVYRLEYAHNKHNGPFNPPPMSERSFFSFVSGGTLADLRPAQAAQVVAIATGHKGPYDFPAVRHEGLDENTLKAFADAADERGITLVHGFATMKQYHMWFNSHAIRKALFTDMEEREFNDLELRCFDVPDDKVLKTPTQVVFAIEDAISSKLVQRGKAIR